MPDGSGGFSVAFSAASTTATLAAAALIAASGPALSQDAATPAAAEFALELNNAQDTDAGGCRLTYVATNNSDNELSETAYEVAVFDADGVVSRILVLEFGTLTAGKTKILQFDLPDSQCSGLSRIVVNDVAACSLADGGGAGDFCLDALVTSSRTGIQFGT